jgi:hypothetical protein
MLVGPPGWKSPYRQNSEEHSMLHGEDDELQEGVELAKRGKIRQ